MLDVYFYDRHMITPEIKKLLKQKNLWDEEKLRLVAIYPNKTHKKIRKRKGSIFEYSLGYIGGLEETDPKELIESMFFLSGEAGIDRVTIKNREHLILTYYSEDPFNDGPAPPLVPKRLKARLYGLEELNLKQLYLLHKADLDIGRLNALILFDADKNRLFIEQKNNPSIDGGEIRPWKACSYITSMLAAFSGEGAIRTLQVGQKRYIAGAAYKIRICTVQMFKIDISDLNWKKDFLF